MGLAPAADDVGVPAIALRAGLALADLTGGPIAVVDPQASWFDAPTPQPPGDARSIFATTWVTARLAVISPTRAAALPDLPTMAEAGLPGFDVPIWFGLVAPAGTPQPIIDRLHRETVRVLTAPDVRQRYGTLGLEVAANTPAEFSAVIKSEIPRWAKLINEARIKVGE